MKSFAVSFMVILLTAFFAVAKDDNGRIQFEEKVHDFGTIKEENGPVSYEFEFKNVGDGPITIISANASCGCTRPEYPQEPIRPGKKGKIKITYNPAGRPGEFDRKVRIRTSDEKRRVVLRITGVVIPKNVKE